VAASNGINAEKVRLEIILEVNLTKITRRVEHVSKDKVDAKATNPKSKQQSLSAGTPVNGADPATWKLPGFYVWILGFKKGTSLPKIKRVVKQVENPYVSRIEIVFPQLVRPIIKMLTVSSAAAKTDSDYAGKVPVTEILFDKDKVFDGYATCAVFLDPSMTMDEAKDWVTTGDAAALSKVVSWVLFAGQDFAQSDSAKHSASVLFNKDVN
jgi:hypothetical protein